jgi:hypothetical protein
MNNAQRNQKHFKSRLILLSLAVSLVLFAASNRSYHAIQPTIRNKFLSSVVNQKNSLACPALLPQTSHSHLLHQEWYTHRSQQIRSNLSAYMQVFKQVPQYDNWGHSYHEVKTGMLAWKQSKFKDLQSNGSIYESACGIGLNLYMTLEILNEEYGVTDLHVHGNDYVRESVEIASMILPPDATICVADSTNLSHVPSNAFDLVYTGYISPLLDPLQLNLSTNTELFAAYSTLCESSPADNQHAQNIQDAWYRSWVSEMIRIAKPGAPIIVEQVSYSLCTALFDWGGVEQSFWNESIQRYQWDVDSLDMQDDVLFRRRYHVFMRKKKAKSRVKI